MIQDIGYIIIRYDALEDGKVVEKERTEDLFDLWHGLDAEGQPAEVAGDPLGAINARTTWLRRRGFDGISVGGAWCLYEKLFDQVAEVKKKILSGRLVGTAKSTGSPSGGSGGVESPPA